LNISLSCVFRTLPVAPCGISGTKTTSSGSCHFATLLSRKPMTASAASLRPGLPRRRARAACPFRVQQADYRDLGGIGIARRRVLEIDAVRRGPFTISRAAERRSCAPTRRRGRPPDAFLPAGYQARSESRWQPEAHRDAQNAFGRPACFKIAFASSGLRRVRGTVNVRCVIGLNQISWLPLPCRSNRHPASRNSALRRRYTSLHAARPR
jgi:hypothetical protein